MPVPSDWNIVNAKKQKQRSDETNSEGDGDATGITQYTGFSLEESEPTQMFDRARSSSSLSMNSTSMAAPRDPLVSASNDLLFEDGDGDEDDEDYEKRYITSSQKIMERNAGSRLSVLADAQIGSRLSLPSVSATDDTSRGSLTATAGTKRSYLSMSAETGEQHQLNLDEPAVSTGGDDNDEDDGEVVLVRRRRRAALESQYPELQHDRELESGQREDIDIDPYFWRIDRPAGASAQAPVIMPLRFDVPAGTHDRQRQIDPGSLLISSAAISANDSGEPRSVGRNNRDRTNRDRASRAVDNDESTSAALFAGTEAAASDRHLSDTTRAARQLLADHIAVGRQTRALERTEAPTTTTTAERLIFEQQVRNRVAQATAAAAKARADIIERNYRTRPSFPNTFVTAKSSSGATLYFPKINKQGAQTPRDLKETLEPTGRLSSMPLHHLLTQVENTRLRIKMQQDLEQHRKEEAQTRAAAAAAATGGVSLSKAETLWVDKYAPRMYVDLIGDERLNREVLTWVKQWDMCVFKKPVKRSFAKLNESKFRQKSLFGSNKPQDPLQRPDRRILLLAGPPGLGKTTLAHVVAKHSGYNVVEINARRSPSASAQTESSTQDKMQMSDGTRAGLQSGAAIREHFAAQRREQQERLAAMDAAQLGRDAPTVHRDKLGRIIDPEALRAEMLAEKARKEKEEQERIEWGKGVAQRQAKEAMEKRLIEERTSNFAVYRDDVDYNRELMARDRWGDPMAFMTSQNKDAGIDGSSSKHKRSRKREVYKGPPPPPNRYGIAPGYRWDGVDRSNGFEAKFFQAKHAKAVFDDAAHKWSTENM
eukprot:jgi/Hompol1/6797/HPOL_001201-RA